MPVVNFWEQICPFVKLEPWEQCWMSVVNLCEQINPFVKLRTRQPCKMGVVNFWEQIHPYVKLRPRQQCGMAVFNFWEQIQLFSFTKLEKIVWLFLFQNNWSQQRRQKSKHSSRQGWRRAKNSLVPLLLITFSDCGGGVGGGASWLSQVNVNTAASLGRELNRLRPPQKHLSPACPADHRGFNKNSQH